MSTNTQDSPFGLDYKILLYYVSSTSRAYLFHVKATWKRSGNLMHSVTGILTKERLIQQGIITDNE